MSQECERCKLLEAHLEDLRNKYGRIHTYFQLLNLKPQQRISEEVVIACNDQFVELLKKDV